MITPSWNAPAHIKSLSTTRVGGLSEAPFASNNLGQHVGDNPETVAANRTLLNSYLPAPPIWLDQRHTTTIIDINTHTGTQIADGSVTNTNNVVCCIMTADCLPILLTDKQGSQVAAVHAGWRGLCDGIVENAIAAFSCPAREVIAWLGPAIGPNKFEVGQEVVDRFCQRYPSDKCCFELKNNRYLADLYQLATKRLQRAGVIEVSGGEYCTYQQSELFFSYRREGKTGRMASMIWIEK